MATEVSLGVAAAGETDASCRLPPPADLPLVGFDVGQEILSLKRELLEVKNILKDLIAPMRAGGGKKREAGIADGSDATRWTSHRDFNLLPLLGICWGRTLY